MTQDDEEEEDNLQAMFEEWYDDSIKIAKKTSNGENWLKLWVRKNEELKNKMEMLEQEYKDVTSINEELVQEVVEKDDELLKLVGG